MLDYIDPERIHRMARQWDRGTFHHDLGYDRPRPKDAAEPSEPFNACEGVTTGCL